MMTAKGSAATPEPPRTGGLHGHEHAHEGRTHRHPHHHVVPSAHEHGHTMAFERFSYVCSPVHDLDPRAKVLAALVTVAGIVMTAAPRGAEVAALVMLFASIALLARVPLGALALRSAVVLPVAGGIALFAPLALLGSPEIGGIADAYRAGWPLLWSIITRAWLSACVLVLLSATTSPPRLFTALRKLGMPQIFLTMLTFLYRYAAVLGSQVQAMRRSIASRAPMLSRWRVVRLYGNLAGNLFIRAYERGERVHAAMMSRGYDGSLPSTQRLHMGPADLLAVATSVLVCAAIALY